MKKMMMVFVVLFAMVGSSFGETNWYDANNQLASSWHVHSGSVKVAAINVSKATKWSFSFKADNNEYYVIDENLDHDVKKGFLATIIAAKNTQSAVNVKRTLDKSPNGNWYVVDNIVTF